MSQRSLLGPSVLGILAVLLLGLSVLVLRSCPRPAVEISDRSVLEPQPVHAEESVLLETREDVDSSFEAVEPRHRRTSDPGTFREPIVLTGLVRFPADESSPGDLEGRIRLSVETGGGGTSSLELPIHGGFFEYRDEETWRILEVREVSFAGRLPRIEGFSQQVVEGVVKVLVDVRWDRLSVWALDRTTGDPLPQVTLVSERGHRDLSNHPSFPRGRVLVQDSRVPARLERTWAGTQDTDRVANLWVGSPGYAWTSLQLCALEDSVCAELERTGAALVCCPAGFLKARGNRVRELFGPKVEVEFLLSIQSPEESSYDGECKVVADETLVEGLRPGPIDIRLSVRIEREEVELARGSGVVIEGETARIDLEAGRGLTEAFGEGALPDWEETKGWLRLASEWEQFTALSLLDPALTAQALIPDPSDSFRLEWKLDRFRRFGRFTLMSQHGRVLGFPLLSPSSMGRETPIDGPAEVSFEVVDHSSGERLESWEVWVGWADSPYKDFADSEDQRSVGPRTLAPGRAFLQAVNVYGRTVVFVGDPAKELRPGRNDWRVEVKEGGDLRILFFDARNGEPIRSVTWGSVVQVRQPGDEGWLDVEMDGGGDLTVPWPGATQIGPIHVPGFETTEAVTVPAQSVVRVELVRRGNWGSGG